MPLTDVYGTETGGPGLSYGLDGVTDWGPAQAFLNVFKTARAWVGHEADQWGGVSYQDMQDQGLLDEDGYLTGMPEGVESVETFVLTEMPEEASYTAGRYRLTYDGEGDVQVGGTATNVVYGDGEIWFDYEPNGEGIVTIGFTTTDPEGTGDYLRNFELVKEDNIPAYEAGEIFNPMWLDNLDEAHALRFMDWMQTNNSDVVSWDDRPTTGDFTWSMGVPVEIMVELANQTGTEPWFNIPHDADAAFIQAFAEYVRDNLDPDLRAHFEFSNEVWNFLFEQARDSAEEAQDRFGTDLPDGWMQEYGASAAEMAKILDAVFAGHEDQLVKVIATHTGWPGLEESILEAPDYVALDPSNEAPYTYFDTYAITGYFGASLGNEKAETVLSWIAESLSDAESRADSLGLSGTDRSEWIAAHQYDLATELAVQELRDGSVTGNEAGSLAELFDLFGYHASVAAGYGLDLVMYEGGTHVVAGGEYTGNAVLTEFFIHLNYSEGMGELYSELLAGWVEAGGTLFNAFVDVAEPTQWGSWGSLRYLGDENSRDDALDAFSDEYPRLDQGGTIVDRDADDAGPDNPGGAILEGTGGDDLILHDFEGRTRFGDRILGGAGNDIIYDGQGSDTIDAGAGYDLISLWDDGNTLDVIENFDPGADMLDLSPQGIYALSQLIVAQIGDSSDLMIDFGGDRVILRGMWDQQNGTPRVSLDNLLLAQPPEGADPSPAPIPYTGPMPGDDTPTEPEAPVNPVEPGPVDPGPEEPETPPQSGGTGALLQGTGGDDLILHDFEGRTSLGDRILGGAGNDIIYDGQGSDTIDAGAGYDLISLWDDSNTLDVIENFDPGTDMLDLSPQGIYALSQLIVAQIGDSSDLMIDFGGDRVILRGMWDTATGTHMLSADNLLLAQPPEGADPSPAPIPYTGPMPGNETPTEPEQPVDPVEPEPVDPAPVEPDPIEPETPEETVDPDLPDNPGIPEVDAVREYIFGHSLINHASDTPATAVPWWVDAFADATDGSSYAFAGQYGFLPQHDDLPPSSNWGYDGIDSAWDSEAGESFGEADFTHVTITAGNFIQWQGADQPYWNDPNTTPISATLDIIDFVTSQEPGVTVLIYENWPDMGEYISSWPPTRAEFNTWCDYLRGDFHQWWVDYTDALQEARPEANIRMVPVGPLLADMLQSPDFGLDDIPLEQLFSDDAPHGTPSLYFLASIIHYAALYGAMPPADFQIPEGVHPDIIAAYPVLLAFVGSEMSIDAGTESEPTPDPEPQPDPEVDPDTDGDEDAGTDPDDQSPDETDPETPGPTEPDGGDHAPDVDWSDPESYAQLIEGSKGDDRIFGTDDDDFIFGGAGKDILYGSAGRDHMDGGDGYDRVQYQDHDQDIVIDMNDPSSSTGSAYGDTFESIERVSSGNGNDIIRLATGVRGDGGNGNDRIIDADGHEEMHGGNGADVFVFQSRDGALDRIIDFHAGEDMIDLVGWQTSWDEITITGDSKGRAYITVEGDTLRVDNAWNADTGEHIFSEDDFIF